MKTISQRLQRHLKNGVLTAFFWSVYACMLYFSFKFNFWDMYTDNLKEFHPTYGECVLFVSVVNFISFNTTYFDSDKKIQDK